MAKCEYCEKDVAFGIKVSHSHRRANRTWKPNVKRVKAIVDGTPKHVYACTRCLRSGKVTRAVGDRSFREKEGFRMSRSRARTGAAHSPRRALSNTDFDAIKKRKSFLKKSKKGVDNQSRAWYL